jgi:hypothetical protein
VSVLKAGGIPKVAVIPLIKHCNKLAEKNGRSGLEIFEEYLTLIKKYSDYFFSEDQPVEPGFWSYSSKGDWNFAEAGKSRKEKAERFVVVCLKDQEFGIGGKISCWGCQVSEAMDLREFLVKLEQAKRENEEEMKESEPSPCTVDMYRHYRRPEVVRMDKMKEVHLKFLEEFALTEGKSCTVKNKHFCPYGAMCEQLIKCGGETWALWEYVDWYDAHWNRNPSITPSRGEMKWYHGDEPSIIDVTDYDDIVKALDDGRMERIMKECERYEKEHRD